jgi:hypothetical protein
MKDLTIDEKVGLAIKRVKYILTHESDTITDVHTSGDGTIIITLSNGMNFQLTSGEMEYRAEEQLLEERTISLSLAIKDITNHYVNTIVEDVRNGDVGLLTDFIVGDNMPKLCNQSIEELEDEYFDIFRKKVRIVA